MKPGYIFLVLWLLVGCARVQSDTQASVVGTATDQSGAVVPNAKITATNVATRIALTTSTDDKGDKGNYRFSLLNPGTYNLVEHATSDTDRDSSPRPGCLGWDHGDGDKDLLVASSYSHVYLLDGDFIAHGDAKA